MGLMREAAQDRWLGQQAATASTGVVSAALAPCLGKQSHGASQARDETESSRSEPTRTFCRS